MTGAADGPTPYLDKGVDFDTRTVWLGDLDCDSAGHFVRCLHELMKRGDDPITVMLMSGGGDWTAALAIYDAIRDANTQVYCEVIGHCMSGAVVVAQACDKRFIHPNAAVMIHNGSHAGEYDVLSFESWGHYNKRERHRMYELIARRTGRKPTFWRRKCANGDFIMDADQALELGLFDAIVGSEFA